MRQRDVGEGWRAEPRQALVERAGAAGEPGACVVDGPAWATGGGRAAAVLVCGEPGVGEEATYSLPWTQGRPHFHSHKEAAAFLSLVCAPPRAAPKPWTARGCAAGRPGRCTGGTRSWQEWRLHSLMVGCASVAAALGTLPS